jgi:hypothetical protein
LLGEIWHEQTYLEQAGLEESFLEQGVLEQPYLDKPLPHWPDLVELIHCFLQSLVPSVAVVREIIHLSLADPSQVVDSGLPPPEHDVPLIKKHDGHLILLTGHNKFLSPSYHQNIHRKIIIFSNHKQACMSPQPHNTPGHALQIVFLGQVVLEPEGPVGVCHGNKGDTLGLVVDKVVQRRHESIRGVLKHVHDGLLEVWMDVDGLVLPNRLCDILDGFSHGSEGLELILSQTTPLPLSSSWWCQKWLVRAIDDDGVES